MKLPLLLAAALSGCEDTTSDGSCEESAPLLQDIRAGCSEGVCTWRVETSGCAGLVDLSLIQNGDPGFDCSQGTSGQIVCGVWTEHHDSFFLEDFDDDGETMRIDLDLVDSFDQQVENVSTIFDLDAAAIASELTVMVSITDEEGGYADCARYGYDSSYYAVECENSWD